MSQNQTKHKKCQITAEELRKRFQEADINGDGTLSADQITTLLQSLGFQDTYKGTIRKVKLLQFKICRYLNKQKRLRQSQQQKSPQNIEIQNQLQSQTDIKAVQKSQDIKNETDEEKKRRKADQKKKEEQQAAITFEEFSKYFQILDKPIGKTIYNFSLERSVKIAQISKEINLKNKFHKDKGQKLKLNILVGDEKPSYNSRLEFKLLKEVKNEQSQDTFFIKIAVTTTSEQNAKYLATGLKSLYETAIQLISAENQEFEQIDQIIDLQLKAEGKITIMTISTKDDNVRELIRSIMHTFDQILQTEVTFFLRFLLQFNFKLSQIKENQKSVIEDLLVKDSNIKVQYTGSQFIDALKEIALAKNFFELLRLDNDPVLLALLGFLSMEKGEVFLKFNNLQRQQASKLLTLELIQQMGIINQLETQTFSMRKVSQLVERPITITAQLQNIKLAIDIDIPDLLKLPYMNEMPGYNAQNDSD